VSILPSKKFLSVFILTAAFVAAVILAFGREKSSEVINIASNLTAGDKVAIPENPNWQNELGVLNTNKVIDETESASTKETITDAVSRSLISNYLALKQTGKLDSTSAQKLLDQSVSYIEQSGTQVAKITQFNIIPDNGTKTIADYGENLGIIVRSKSVAEIKEDFNLIAQIFSTPNKTNLNTLDGIISGYEKILNALVKMPVPQTFVKAHTDIVNGTNGMISALKTIKDIPNDPLKGMIILQSYQNSVMTLSQAVNATITFIKQNNIIYKQGSGGYYLIYGI
jgi:hypothetical protein